MMRLLLLIITCGVLWGCSISKPLKMPEIKKYTLSKVSTKKYPSRKPSDIYVSYVNANPGYSSNAMVYIKTPYRLQHFSKSTWVDSPATLFHGLLVQSLRNSGQFKAVLAPPYSAFTRYRLDTNLLVLQQEFNRVPSQIRMVMEASLVDNAKNKVISQQRFQVLESAPAENPYGGVLAANRASQKMQTNIVKFVAKSAH